MVEILGKSIVTSNKRITLPADVAKHLEIDIGDVIGFELDNDGEVYLVKYILKRVQRKKEKK